MSYGIEDHTKRQELINTYGLTLDAVFVPFSASRNKGEKFKSLNWKVTLKRNGREIVTTDYMQGITHAPSYKVNFRTLQVRAAQWTRDNMVAIECETGRKAKLDFSNDAYPSRDKIAPPSIEGVLYSLLMDADVLDAGGFEEWASNFGYDTDSRQAEKLYRDCLDIALKLRAGLGDAAMTELKEAFEGY
jgi:hypothetical protein